MAETEGEPLPRQQFSTEKDEADVFEYPRQQIHPGGLNLNPLEVKPEHDGGEDDPAEVLHVTITGSAPPPQLRMFIKVPPKSGDMSQPDYVDMLHAEDLKDIANDAIHSHTHTMRSLRGVYRLFSIDALFIVETNREKIPFRRHLGQQDFYYEVLSQGEHIIYYATGKRIRPCCSVAPRIFNINLFDFDGAHVCVFDMERSICRFNARIQSPAVKFGSIKYGGCTMRAPHFRIRNKHLRTDFLAYPMKRRKTWTIPHEYWILGVTTDEKVAHVGKIWNEDEFPIIVRRSLNSKQRMYGVVFEEPLRMFQKLNLLGLAFAIKFLRRDFDPPPPFVKTDRKMIIPAVPITSSEGKE